MDKTKTGFGTLVGKSSTSSREASKESVSKSSKTSESNEHNTVRDVAKNLVRKLTSEILMGEGANVAGEGVNNDIEKDVEVLNTDAENIRESDMEEGTSDVASKVDPVAVPAAVVDGNSATEGELLVDNLLTDGINSVIEGGNCFSDSAGNTVTVESNTVNTQATNVDASVPEQAAQEIPESHPFTVPNLPVEYYSKS